jgi:hypothetical protein
VTAPAASPPLSARGASSTVAAISRTAVYTVRQAGRATQHHPTGLGGLIAQVRSSRLDQERAGSTFVRADHHGLLRVIEW